MAFAMQYGQLMRRLVLIAALVLAARTAHADVEALRDDIVEMRHGRSPNHSTVLGWTADHRLVVHRAECGMNDGGGEFCFVTLHVVDDKRDTAGVMLEGELACSAYDCNGNARWTVTTERAAKAIVLERSTLAALGLLTAAVAEPAPRQIGVDVVGGCTVRVRAHGKTLARPLRHGKDCLWNGGNESIWGAAVDQIVMSPDGVRGGALITVSGKSNEYFTTEHVIGVFAMP